MVKVSENTSRISNLEAELYLLIAKFLGTGPCSEAADVLRREIEEHDLLPKRIDWLGNEHCRTFNELTSHFSQIADDHLLKICSKIGPILDREVPTNVPGLTSLLGVGRQSLLRTKEDVQKSRCTVTNLMARKNGMPLFPPLTAHSSYPPNITQVLVARELSGGISSRHAFSPKIYARQQMYRRLLGHLSSVYCVLFDRTGKYIFTGADDLLVKIWSATDGRLLAALRGHSAEITDMAVNYENTLLAAGSCDKTIRVWCLRTMTPVAVLNGHTAMVTSLQFCPYPKKKEHLLISTGNDGCVCFWQWNPGNNAFNPKPLKFTERNKAGAQMICSSFSPGGVFLATGSTDHNIRVYNIAGLNGPEKILEREAHVDRVDSLQFSNLGCRFISGSKDGTALIWRYERQSWSSIQLKMSTKLLGIQSDEPEDSKVKLRVTMVGWTLDDSKVITAVSDCSIKVWNSNDGALCYILKGHEDEVFVLEPHPTDPRVFLSSGHDGRIIIWDLLTGTAIKNHFNLIEGQGHGAVFDCKFSPDGHMFASTDSHGHLSIFGFGSNDRYKRVPEEQFFHTDYRPLIRDIHHHVLDEQTQTAPHLLPPPFLVDIDGNPYPPHLQRLVPGREQCNDSQLIPYVAVSAEGEAEILEPVRPANEGASDRPTIDDMIERLQQERSINLGQGESSDASTSRPTSNDSFRSPRSSRRLQGENGDRSSVDPFSPRTPRSQAGHSRVGLRRTGDVEGVQSVGNWQSRTNQGDLPSLVKLVVVKPISPSLSNSYFRRRVGLAEFELMFFNREKKKRAFPDPSEEYFKQDEKEFGNQRRGMRAGLRSTTQDDSVFSEEYENPDTNHSNSSSDSEQEQKEPWSDSTEESGSGEYSDWIEESQNGRTKGKSKGEPKPSTSGHSSRPTRPRRVVVSSDEEDSDEDKEDEAQTSSSNKPSSSNGTRKKSHRKVPPSKTKPAINGKKLPERFRPPEWLTDVMPHKAPFVPQLGDEVVYFRQGHELYVQAVKRNRIYEIYTRSQPWRKINLRDQEVARIEDITFVNHPPRLCCLKLQLLNPADKHEDTFVVKYHDMADVIDFIVLKQNYDQAMHYDWKAGDRFRSAIDKAWWLGTILSQKPLNPNFPDSMFQCFFVKWDNGEKEHMSPWDFEPIDNERLPEEEGGSVDITPEEQLLMMYIPEVHEWSSCGQVQDCERIARGFHRIMELSIAEPFVQPVDLNQYPSYAMVVEYPMDLGTIRARLQNRFYRRLDAVKFDVKYIENNAKTFNEPTSRIVKQAKCVVDLCLKFIDSHHCRDPMVLYHEMMEAKQSRSQDSQSELDVLCSESDSDWEQSSKKRLKRKKQNALHQSNKRARLGSQKYTSRSWKQQCASLLDSMLQWDDSMPFRYPVSLNEFPDYRDIIDCPMDLSTVRERLANNHYDSPTDFCKDMRLIFQNSRTYNTNKKSRIYSMTIRLSAMFEEHIRSIVSDWRSAVKYEDKIRNNQYVSNRRKPLILDASVNVGASTSHSLSLVEVSRHRTNQSACQEPGTSRNTHRTNDLGSKKKKKQDESLSTKSSAAQVKRKYMKNAMRTPLTNGDVRKKIIKVKKRKLPQRTSRKTNGILRKKELSNAEESNTSQPFNSSEASSASDDSEYIGSKRKKVCRDSNKKLQRIMSPAVKRYTRSSAPYRSPASPRSLVSRPKRSVLSRLVSHASSPRKTRWMTMKKRVALAQNTSVGVRSSLPRNRVKPQKYQTSGESSESEASEPQSGGNSNNSASTSSLSIKHNRGNQRKCVQSSSHSEPEDNSEEDKIPKFRRSARTARTSPPKELSARIQTRNRGQRTVQYAEYNEDSPRNYDSVISFSSRGRLRSSLINGVRNLTHETPKSKSAERQSKKGPSDGDYSTSDSNMSNPDSTTSTTHSAVNTKHESRGSCDLDSECGLHKETKTKKIQYINPHQKKSVIYKKKSLYTSPVTRRAKPSVISRIIVASKANPYKWNLRAAREASRLSFLSTSKNLNRSRPLEQKTTQHPDIVHVKRKYSESDCSQPSTSKSDDSLCRNKVINTGKLLSYKKGKSKSNFIVKKWFLRSTPEDTSRDTDTFTGSKSSEKFYEVQTRNRGQRTITYEENIDEIYSKENYEDEDSGLFCITKNKSGTKSDTSENSNAETEHKMRKRTTFQNYCYQKWAFGSSFGRSRRSARVALGRPQVDEECLKRIQTRNCSQRTIAHLKKQSLHGDRLYE